MVFKKGNHAWNKNLPREQQPRYGKFVSIGQIENMRLIGKKNKGNICTNGFKKEHEPWNKGLKDISCGWTKGKHRTGKDLERVKKLRMGCKLSDKHKLAISIANRGHGHPAFNKGMTKDTSLSVLQGSQKLKRLYKDGHAKCGFKKGSIPHNKNKTKVDYVPLKRTSETLHCWYINPKNEESIKEKFKKVSSQHNTKPERLIRGELEKRQIIFKYQKGMKIGRKYRVVDFFIEPNIIIEVDGNYWHKYPEGLSQDKFKDDLAQQCGYITMRFWESEIHSSLSSIGDFIENHWRTLR